MLFLFNLIYAATWGTAAFLVPTEIFPPEMSTQGNSWHNWLGDRRRPDRSHQPDHVHTHWEPHLFPLCWPESALDPDRVFFLSQDRELISRADQRYVRTIKTLVPRYRESLCGWRGSPGELWGN
jgi:hypothetical protein